MTENVPCRATRAVLACALLAGLSLPAVARTSACETMKAQMRAYLDCLGSTQKASERRLERAIDAARAAIAARVELKQVQRNRWTALLEESHGRFVHWRDFECQSIAPYEGGGAEKTIGGRVSGIGALEQRLICVISLNEGRIADIEQRYRAPPDWLESHPDAALAEGADRPESPADSAETAPVSGGVPRLIELSP
ncbi:lysozyme inhibitor LprI family protein [Ancylobacter sp. A5.8]|uniref:lysozyme inhibitor LprI family protein n=1 Tax=Ancylobacter gelatini TaxID=2919920 RepID=UPI001F4E4019|nr:lysozyme inhibitor LprI family protein [Ancylobacter gelatini]MCJ8144823.1 lysozyme inhibitor LprI family protein [Ancylobacter gelatini]